jgi:hypothetical protein
MPSDTEPGSVHFKQTFKTKRPACRIYRLLQSGALNIPALLARSLRLKIRILLATADGGSSWRSSEKSRAFVVVVARG